MGVSFYAEERGRAILELEALTEKLESVERVFDMFLHQCPFVIWCKDCTEGDGRMLFISDMYSDVFGVSEADYVGKTDKEVWPETIAALFRSQDMQVINTGEPVYMIEPTPLAREQEWRRCHTYKFPLKNKKGEVVAVGGIAWPDKNVGAI